MSRRVLVYLRHGSTRLPGKIYRELWGEPLYKVSLLKLREYRVSVDTDSDRVLEEIERDPRLGHVTAYRRSEEHARDPEPGLGMTRRFLEDLPADEVVGVVHVTSPFLHPRTLERLFEAVESGGNDSAATVTIIRDFAYRLGPRGEAVPLNHDGRNIPGTERLDPVFHLNHAAYVFTRASIEAWGHRIGARPHFQATVFPENVDIDYPSDWALAETASRELAPPWEQPSGVGA